VKISIAANSKDELTSGCTIELLDKNGKLLDLKSVEFAVLTTTEYSDVVAENLKTGPCGVKFDGYDTEYLECADICGFFDFKCMFEKFSRCSDTIIWRLTVLGLIGINRYAG
jgi:hypothetical protein